MAVTVAAVAAIFAAAPVQAETRDMGLIPPGQENPIFPPISHAPGSFTDTVTFEFAVGGPDGGIRFDDFNFTPFIGIINATLSLTGPAGFTPITNFALADEVFNPFSFVAGSYTATINGDAVGTAGGTYSLSIAAPTPEPAVWVSLGMGLLLAGRVAAKRRKQAAAV
jgi:hypothetical protein